MLNLDRDQVIVLARLLCPIHDLLDSPLSVRIMMQSVHVIVYLINCYLNIKIHCVT
jgi:hypothetical protein